MRNRHCGPAGGPMVPFPATHPDRTPKTRLSMKKEPIMMRGMKYSQFQVFPEASLACGHKDRYREGTLEMTEWTGNRTNSQF